MKQLARNLHNIILGLESEFGMNNFQTDHANCASSEQRNAIISVPDASIPIGALSYSCVGVLSGTYFIHMWFSNPPLRRGKETSLHMSSYDIYFSFYHYAGETYSNSEPRSGFLAVSLEPGSMPQCLT